MLIKALPPNENQKVGECPRKRRSRKGLVESDPRRNPLDDNQLQGWKIWFTSMITTLHSRPLEPKSSWRLKKKHTSRGPCQWELLQVIVIKKNIVGTIVTISMIPRTTSSLRMRLKLSSDEDTSRSLFSTDLQPQLVSHNQKKCQNSWLLGWWTWFPEELGRQALEGALKRKRKCNHAL